MFANTSTHRHTWIHTDMCALLLQLPEGFNNLKVWCTVFEIWPCRKTPPGHKRTGFHWSHNWNYNSQQLLFISGNRSRLEGHSWITWKTYFRKARVRHWAGFWKSVKLPDFWLQPVRSFDTDVHGGESLWPSSVQRRSTVRHHSGCISSYC